MENQYHAAENYIESASKSRLYFVDRDPAIYKNKITLLYGSTGSGKSTILKDILYILKDEIAIVIAFCPTNFVSNDYEGLIPPNLIYREVDLCQIQKIYQEQERRATYYKIANNASILSGIFNKIRDNKDLPKAKMIVSQAQKILDDINSNPHLTIEKKISEKKKIEDLREKKLINIFKIAIRKNKKYIFGGDLSKIEKQALKYIDFNPHTILIFDDCLSSAARWKNSEIFKALFMQGRHSKITQIYTLQDDKGITPGLRQQAQISIFTTPHSVISHINTKNNGYSARTKKAIEGAANCIFEQDPENHYKLFYDKFANECKVIRAAIHDEFRTGSKYLWKYMEKVPKKDGAAYNIKDSAYLRTLC